MSGILSTGLGVTDWLSFSASAGVIRITAYDASNTGNGPLKPTNLRHLATYSVGASVSPIKGLSTNLTLDSTGLQLAPNGERRNPFSIQNSTLILGISYDVGSLASDDKEKS